MGIVLKAENVAIRYITGDFKDIGIKEYAVRKLTHNYHVKEFMAVDGVSFELEEGDLLGIIGANGAGKSTLLKAIAGIMEPTRGKVTINGETAALLELGSGFDGDLTVKENAYLRGAMLGYTQEFMDQTYNQIIDFAELREFEDRPFKQLSSGMKSRLAFSIASLVQPDILILDEVLSVGDGAFQEKSAKKMREIIANGAATILVSHSLDQIRELCTKVLWLEHGKQVAFGETEEICDRYESFLRGDYSIEITNEDLAEERDTADAVEARRGDVNTKGRISVKRMAVSLVVALCCAVLAVNLGQQFLLSNLVSHVKIAALEGSGEVTFRGAMVDGGWVSPSDHTADDGGWVYDAEQAVYTAIDGGTLVFDLPAGNERTLTFTAGPDAGVALVDIDGDHYEFNLWNENVVELGLPYNVPDFSIQSMLRQVYILALAVLVVVLILCLAFYKEKSEPKREVEILKKYSEKGRIATNAEINGLKGILAVIIALFHFGQSYPIGNVFHRGYFAVEVFFMISGFLLANRCERLGTEMHPLQELLHKLKNLYFPYLLSIISLVILYSATWFSWNPIAWVKSDPTHFRSLISELLCIQVTGVGGLKYVNGPVWYVSALLLATVIIVVLYRCLHRRWFWVDIFVLTITIYSIFFFVDPYMNSAGFLNGTNIPTPLLRGIAGVGAGCSLYWVYIRFFDVTKNKSWLKYFAVASCFLLLILLVFGEPSKCNYLIFIPAAMSVLSLFWLEGHKKIPVLSSAPVQFLGEISYPFFVMQSFSQNFVSIYITPNVDNPLTLNTIYILLNLLLACGINAAVGRLRQNKMLKKFCSPRVLCIMLLAVIFATLCVVGNAVADGIEQSTQVSICSADGTITFRGAEVDGIWLTPYEVITDSGNWTEDVDLAAYTSITDQPLLIDLPLGSRRLLIFNSGPDEGSVRIDWDHRTTYWNLYSDGNVEFVQSYLLPNIRSVTLAGYSIFVVFICMIFLLCLFRRPRVGDKRIEARTKRNGFIELLRFIICICVCIHHYTGAMPGGYLGVDFFFILSGFLLMKHFTISEDLSISAGEAALLYTKSRYLRLIPHYLFSFFMSMLLTHILSATIGLHMLLSDSIWELLMLESVGIGGNLLVGPGWYCSSLIIAGFVIYFLLKKSKTNYLYMIAPISLAIIWGWMYQDLGHLNRWIQYDTLVSTGTLRGFAELGLGCMCYQAYCGLNKKWHGKFGIQSAFVELLCFGCIFYIMGVVGPSRADFACTLVMAVLITSAFIGNSLFSKILKTSRAAIYLGKISMAIFLNHVVLSKLNFELLFNVSWQTGVKICLAIAIIFSCVSTEFVDSLEHFGRTYWERQKKES